ncbi:hypothetical protein SAMN05444162_0131 [Paenibacillaceae bacterium GAS479]|nr:hypothetical protein SAMN05444162_0131 [Paenibacillaceae bacterium GAS479]
MDYNAFFADVTGWIQYANQQALRLGLQSADFWAWVADSTGAMCRHYQDHPLVIKQMVMLAEWLEEAYDARL